MVEVSSSSGDNLKNRSHAIQMVSSNSTPSTSQDYREHGVYIQDKNEKLSMPKGTTKYEFDQLVTLFMFKITEKKDRLKSKTVFTAKPFSSITFHISKNH
ncbi:unnamed protein product [Caenorhabditis auriculariae]|uniref:Uncharacterized protein n=1 Tax=Caenorhabditis auriculariae TaxID=2777116 RepID=A0A8S1HK93_9PELO|nr:unnamed protein product [Caenorhabditis auriculariae]